MNSSFIQCYLKVSNHHVSLVLRTSQRRTATVLVQKQLRSWLYGNSLIEQCIKAAAAKAISRAQSKPEDSTQTTYKYCKRIAPSFQTWIEVLLCSACFRLETAVGGDCRLCEVTTQQKSNWRKLRNVGRYRDKICFWQASELNLIIR